MRRFALGTLLAVVSAVFAATGLRTSAGTTRLKPVQFAPAVGWHLRTGTVHSCPGVFAPRCSQVTSTASTTRYRDCLNNCFPHRTAAAMHAQDIAIQITLLLEHPMRIGHTCAWPPRVTTRRVLAPFEGLPRRIGVYLCQTPVGTREASVSIVFGRAIPTTRQLHLVNAELRRARLG